MRKSRSISSKIAIGISAVVLTLLAQQSDQPRPTCHYCQATYVSVSELDAYTARAVKYGIVDQQVRSVDVGKSQVGVAMVTRGKLVAGTARKGAVAEHEQVSEVYHIIEGTATLLTGPDLVNVKKRPDSEKTVRLQNGPGWNADSIANPQVHHLKPQKEMDMMDVAAGGAGGSHTRQTTASPETRIPSQHSPQLAHTLALGERRSDEGGNAGA